MTKFDYPQLGEITDGMHRIDGLATDFSAQVSALYPDNSRQATQYDLEETLSCLEDALQDARNALSALFATKGI